MLHRIARLLLVVVLVSSGATAPFLHVHAHGADHGVSSSHARQADAHCAHHHAEGVHWHPARNRAPDAAGALAAVGFGHRHAAVALSAAAMEASPVCLAAPGAWVEPPETGVLPTSPGAHAPVDPTAGPDPPPRAVNAARAPPVCS